MITTYLYEYFDETKKKWIGCHYDYASEIARHGCMVRTRGSHIAMETTAVLPKMFEPKYTGGDYSKEDLQTALNQHLKQDIGFAIKLQKIDQLAKQARRDINHGRPTEALKSLDQIIALLKG